MSLNQFQAALAYLIRLPDENKRIDVKSLISKYDLTEKEKVLIQHCSSHYLVKDYGQSMLEARWRMINLDISCLYPIASRQDLIHLWKERFEPNHLHVPYNDLSLEFMDFLLHDPFSKNLIGKISPPYIFDILLYLHTTYYFSKGSIPQGQKLAENSLLQHSQFKIIDLDYDTRALGDELLIKRNPMKFIELAVDINGENEETEVVEITQVPEKIPIILLFVSEGIQMEFRSFEINLELKTFFLDQLSKNPSSSSRPECYEELVGLGLCKAIS